MSQLNESFSIHTELEKYAIYSILKFFHESRKEKKCVLYLLLYESVVFLFPIDEGRNEMKRRDEKSGDTEWWPSTLSRIFPSVRGSSTRTWLNPLCSYRVDSWRRLFKRRAHKDAPLLFRPSFGQTVILLRSTTTTMSSANDGGPPQSRANVKLDSSCTSIYIYIYIIDLQNRTIGRILFFIIAREKERKEKYRAASKTKSYFIDRRNVSSGAYLVSNISVSVCLELCNELRPLPSGKSQIARDVEARKKGIVGRVERAEA